MELHYGEDLAFIHDAGFGHIAIGAAETLIDKLAFAGLHEGLIVELGSGSGISAELLVSANINMHADGRRFGRFGCSARCQFNELAEPI